MKRRDPLILTGIAKGSLYKMGLKRLHLDGKSRLIASLIGKPDYPPCFAQMHEHVQYVSKIPPEEFYLKNAKRMAEATYQVSNWYGMDIPIPITDVYNYEAEALGAKMICGEIDMPTIDFTKPLIKEPSDLDRIDTNFQLDWGRMQYLIDATNSLKEICNLPKIIIHCAPFSLAVGLRTYPKLIRDMRKDPKFAHELFTWISTIVIPRFLKAVRKETKSLFAVSADAWACFPNLTVDMIDEWVIPYNVKLRDHMKWRGMLVLMAGSADYCEENPERFDRETMEACWWRLAKAALGEKRKKGIPVMAMGRTQDWPMEWLQHFATINRFLLFGKRHIIASFNARFIREGSVEAIVDFVKRAIDIMGREGRLIFWFAQIPAATPPENIHAAMEAIKTYGRYPIPEDINSIKFEMPKFDPFDQWVKQNW